MFSRWTDNIPERKEVLVALSIALMIAIPLLVVVICTSCAHVPRNDTTRAMICDPTGKPCLPINKCPACEECPKCEKVEWGDCYHTVAVAVMSPVYDEETGKMESVKPTVTIGEGCRCAITVNGHPFFATQPMEDSLCEEEDNGKPGRRAPSQGDRPSTEL